QKFKIDYPAVALIISGGHTELVSIKKHLDYKVIGKTRDDAAGEAFDKVARMLGLPYPGGPEISKLAAESKSENECEFKLPRPMLNSDNLDFSFSGLKTSVLYLLKKISSSQEKTEITEDNKREIAKEFENSVKEVLLHKTEKALKLCKAKTLILGGGVTANKKIREAFVELIKSKNCQDIKLFIPKKGLSTDNATMIAIAGYSKAKTKKYSKYNTLNAQGNLGIDNSN
ncbi:MAG: tRNA (adenosine(37)-N6)-threonylcarbamoyltransferase complex transferase subunit TsaD, partial [Candidatus Paceibacterota bacterium]